MSKISELSDGGALQSTDYLIAVRSGGNVKVQPAGMTFSSATLTTVDINGGTIDGVTIGGSSAGAGSFTTLTASGDVNFDSGTFFVDESTNRVGVGTTSPGALLELDNGGTSTGDVMVFNLGGENREHSFENLLATGRDLRLNTARDFTIRCGADTAAFPTEGVMIFEHGTNGEAMRIDSSGNVGIGTSSPNAKVEIVNTSAGAVATQLFLHNASDTDGTGARLDFAGLTDGTIPTGSISNIRISAGAYALTFNNYGGGSNAERMRIDSSGNVGIGTASPTGMLHLQGSSSFVTQKFGNSVGDAANIAAYRASPSSLVLYLACNRDTSTGVFADTSAAASNIALFGESNNGYIRFSTSSTNNTAPAERMRLDASGNLLVGTTTSPSDTGTVVADGIYLGGTGAANLLDDYEEGTWTPVVEGSATAGTYTLDNVLAYYTKIGNQVTCYTSFGFSAASGGSGNFVLKGLPFNYKANSVINTSPRISEINTGQPNAINLVMNQLSSSASDRLGLVAILDNSARVFVSITGISTSSSMNVSFTYTVS